jgi:hypothetical protein
MTDIVQMAVLNHSTLLGDTAIEPMIAAVEEYVAAQIGPHWDIAVALHQIPSGDPPPAGMWQTVFLDNSDQANDLGYHELTAEGLPLGRVFVATTQNCSQTVSRVFSHEVIEALVDPALNRTLPGPGAPYAIEVGDPLSLDSQGRMVQGQLMSGIALPAYYFPNYGTTYDLDGHLTGMIPTPAEEGGTFLMWQQDGMWQSQMAARAPDEFMAMQANFGSRRHRRILGASRWRHSTAGKPTASEVAIV